MIEIKSEKVIINGKEEILFGGELHHFCETSVVLACFVSVMIIYLWMITWHA